MRRGYVGLLVMMACSGDPVKTELPPISLPPAGDKQFLNITDALGLRLEPVFVGDPVGTDCEIVRFMGPGLAVVDLDGDERLDVFVPRVGAPDRLYLQRRGAFTEHTTQSGLHNEDDAHGVLAFDVENDGDLDLYVTSPTGRSRFYINDGSANFEEQAKQRGVAIVEDGELAADECSRIFSATAFDIEPDGDLDLLVGAWDLSERSRVFINDGRGYFTDETRNLGFDLHDQAVLTAFPYDVDGDDQEDIIWVSDFRDSTVSLKRGQSWTTTVTGGIQDLVNGMGVDATDLDGDGREEFFATGICVRSPCRDFPGWLGNVLINSGHDIALESGVRNSGWGWGAAFADLDHDLQTDLIATNGYGFLSEFQQDPLQVWRNTGNGQFEPHGGVWGVEENGQTRAVVPADFDGDGDLDLFITRQEQQLLVWRNDLDQAGTVIRLNSNSASRPTIGARVTVELHDGRTALRTLRAAAYLSSRPKTLHFGVAPEEIKVVTVLWPDQSEETFHSPCQGPQCMLTTETRR